MCVRPILIRSKKYRFLGCLSSSVASYVKCGTCYECMKEKSNSVYVRARLEYERCLKAGGVGFMCCLTYSDDCLPSILIDDVRVPVFNKKDCIDFVKRLRTNLDRAYRKTFGVVCPDFKYLICSEFGEIHGRPHYHCLFFFDKSVSVSVFRRSFVESTYCRIDGHYKRYFGYILQCEPINPQKGGIAYSSKYVCKDMAYSKQDDFIRNKIAFFRHMIESKYNILSECDEESVLHNRCIRSRKDYKKDVEHYVRPWRHMLQFYMMSNDMGTSYILEKYKDVIPANPVVNIDGFTYSLPPIVYDRFERFYGYIAKQSIKKTQFVKFLDSLFATLVQFNLMSSVESNDLLEFVRSYVIPYKGRLCISSSLSEMMNYSWDELVDRFKFYEDNDYFTLLSRVSHFIDLFYNSNISEFKFAIASQKEFLDKSRFDVQRKNKGYA